MLNGFFLTVLIVAVSFLRIPFRIIWACMEAGRRNKPSIDINLEASKYFPSFGPTANGNNSNAKKSRFRPNWNLTGIIYHWSVILKSFSVVLNSAKRDANGFFNSHLLISRHPLRKSKFGACAVTGYCSFNLTWIYVCISQVEIHINYISCAKTECINCLWKYEATCRMFLASILVLSLICMYMI